MMTTSPPAPLVPPTVDLRDFQYMPLDVVRLRDSSMVAKRTSDEVVAGVLLWCASWHQVPASSLPDDDAELARLAGYGKGVRDFLRVRDGAIHNLVLCSDGRLYHPVVAEKAAEAWNSKLLESWRRACDNVRKQNKEREAKKLEPLPTPDRPKLLIRRNQGDIPTWVYDDSAGIPQPAPRKSRRKGTEGKGTEGSLLLEGASHPLSGSPPDTEPSGDRKAERTRQLRADAVGILTFLNEKTGSAYQPVAANIDLIVARLKEGATPLKCRQVIAKMARQWQGDPKMDQYVRPKTLFNATNFANYAGTIVDTPDEAAA